MMMNEDRPEDLKKCIHDLELKIAQLEKDLEKERADKETFRQSTKKLKKENEKPEKGTCATTRFRTGSCRDG